ncbi:hypothetical protein [Streptomyces hokutonensis]|uniref:HTH cro/C1-type domain-containing protein n=1 Tax=Streptomyces hokutonensis TaxID=1306990 RepID=A0ABW6M5V2_9ACTN
MDDAQETRAQALSELREHLADALARSRLTKVQLAGLAGLSRSTVQKVFSSSAAAPAAESLVAVGRALRLKEPEVAELLRLRRLAVQPPPPAMRASGPGKSISEWDPHDLEVHPAGPAGRGLDRRELPTYVVRSHDRILSDIVHEAADGHSKLVVLSGSSSTGKTRACWEAVQSLADENWRLWHPFDPTRADAALEDLKRVQACTVVWLNDAQHYFGDPSLGEQIAAAVHGLLTDPDRSPTLVLGTLWDEYVTQYTGPPKVGAYDPHSRVRELLAGRILPVPEAFDRQALRDATALAEGGDQLLADALMRTGADGRVAQDLAGAPELLMRYEHGTPPVRAVVEAAMDARRLGVGMHLPRVFLADAAIDYVSDLDVGHLTDGWQDLAFTALAEPVHGKQAPLRPLKARPRLRPPSSNTPQNRTGGSSAESVLRLADYLEEHGRKRFPLCPPASFWHAAYTHLAGPDDLNELAQAAERRVRLEWASHLRLRAAQVGHPVALEAMALRLEEGGDRERAETVARAAVGIASANASALLRMAILREKAGDTQRAEDLYRLALDIEDMPRTSLISSTLGSPENSLLGHLVATRFEARDLTSAEALAVQAAEAGDTGPLATLATLLMATLMRTGEMAEDWGMTLRVTESELQALMDSFVFVGQKLDEYGSDQEDLLEEALWQDATSPDGDDGAEALYRQAAAAGDSTALLRLAALRAGIGDQDGAETWYRRAADAGVDVDGISSLVQRWPHGLDPDGTPTPAWDPPTITLGSPQAE